MTKLYKIDVNFNKVLKELERNRLLIAIILFCCFYLFFSAMKKNKNKVNTENITKLVENSKFAGNGFFINNNEILTTYDVVDSVCSHTGSRFPNIFVLYNGYVYESTVSYYNNIYRLAIVQINELRNNNDLRQSNLQITDYLMFDRIDNNHSNDDIFYFENNNKAFNPIIKKGKIYNTMDNSFLFKIKGKIKEKSEGVPVLNEQLNIVGITTTNDKKQENLFALNSRIIKKFLKDYKRKFRINLKAIDSQRAKKYLNETVVQIICTDNVVRTLNNRVLIQR